MIYSIEPVFIVFPLICLFLSFFKFKNSKIVFFSILLSFILLYSFSFNGSDYGSYLELYRRVNWTPPSQIQQEIGYYYLMKAAISLGVSYVVFRTVLLSLLSIVLFFFVYKTSSNFPLSIFFITSMFVIYTISTYRQFIVMCFSLWGLYLYYKGKKPIALCEIALLLLFHISAVVPLLFVAYDWICSYFHKNSFVPKEKNYWILVAVSIVIRFLMTFVLNMSFVKAFLLSVSSFYFSESASFFSLGFASRFLFLIAISFLYYRIKKPNGLTTLLYCYYSISILIYTCVPIQLFMGRLMNNANIVCAILIPNILNEYSIQTKTDGCGFKSAKRGLGLFNVNPLLPMLGFVFVALAVLVNQLLHQDGYAPYKNILFSRNVLSGKWDDLNVSYGNFKLTTDNPWNTSVGLVDFDDDTVLFLSPGTSARIETNGYEKLSLTFGLHPLFSKDSDGIGVNIVLMNDQEDYLNRISFVLCDDDSYEFIFDNTWVPECRKVYIDCNGGEKDNTDSDWLIIKKNDPQF